MTIIISDEYRSHNYYDVPNKEYEEKIKQPHDDTRPYYANEWTPKDSFKPQKSEERA